MPAVEARETRPDVKSPDAPDPEVGSNEVAPPEQEEAFRGRHRKKVHPSKLRNKIMSLSVSPEEEALIRAFLNTKGWGFSSWARESLFRSMGRKVPSRRNKFKAPKFHQE